MKNKQTGMTLATLANAGELAGQVIAKLDQDSVSNTLNGTDLSRQTTYNTAQVIFQQEINKRIGA